jgi:hypothetical protein
VLATSGLPGLNAGQFRGGVDLGAHSIAFAIRRETRKCPRSRALAAGESERISAEARKRVDTLRTGAGRKDGLPF